jgi:glycine/D-amino acid oxidase-like deaminating enzyme
VIVTDYRQYSFWLETCGDDLTPRPALSQSAEVDVAILGGGFSGLWTAYYLLRDHPGLTVAVVDRHIAGFGASGRNGGWCSGKFPVSAGSLIERFGVEAARHLMLAMCASVDEVGRVLEVEQIDGHFRKGGILSLARGAHQLPSIRSSYAQWERLGFGDRYRLLSAAESAERVNVANVHGALFTADGAVLHPGRVVRGLARAVERRGGSIYEQTEVTSFETGSRARLVTPGGELRARRAVVLAGEAYLTRLLRLHRALIPMYSLIGLTEPLTHGQWAAIGWRDCESLSSQRLTVDYLTRTGDGRILFGSRGAPYRFGSRISDDQDRHAATHAHIHRSLVDWFPALNGIRMSHTWGGPVGMPRDWMPTVSFDPTSRLATARGYTGQGVSTTNLAGRLLAGLIGGSRTGLETLPLVQHRCPNWETEPLRWMAVRYMQSTFLEIDRADEQGRARPFGTGIALWIGRH